MTKLAIYEKKDGKEDIKLAKYYKSDYARLQMLKTAVAVTIAFLCLVAVGVIYKMEFILNNALDIDYAMLGRKVQKGSWMVTFRHNDHIRCDGS